jgi:hypothetical protein
MAVNNLLKAERPAIRKILDGWGIGRLFLYFEREREFVNIYRGHDIASKLYDEEFEKLLKFKRAAFGLALHFISEEANKPASLVRQQQRTME